MKKKFNYLMEFLKQFNCDKITQDYTFYDGTYDWGLNELHCSKPNGHTTIKTPRPLVDVLEELVNTYDVEIYDIINDHFDENYRYDVYVEIYPKEKVLIYKSASVSYRGTEDSSIEVDFDDQKYDPCLNFLSELGDPDYISIRYDGGGDSGSIESTGTVSDGRTVDIPAGVEDICYNELEYFGGWEINEGSQGEIIITKEYMTINHTWNTEENEDIDLSIRITEDDLD